MIETVGSLGYAKKLGKYGFSDRLCSSKDQCEEWLDFCKKNKMVWFENAYGTLVHKDFNKHFIRLDGSSDEITKAKIELEVMDGNYNGLINLNHSNVIKSKINGCYLVTSSPNYIDWSNIEKYPHQVFIIHPSLLEDYNLNGINLAFSNLSYWEMYDINKAIYEDIGIYGAFRHLHGSYREE